jgi:hypothetical protein
LEVERVQSFTHNDWQFDFIVERNRVSHIVVTVPLGVSDPLPEIVTNPRDPSVKDLQLNLPPCDELLMKVLRTIEGFLSVYGLERIALDEADISWLPETDEEKARVKVRAFNLRFKKPDAFPVPFQLPFSVIKNSIIAAGEALDLEVPLGFFRRGRNDFLERRYIDAIYDFYFVIETVFGNGKTKNYLVKEHSKKCHELLGFSAEVLRDAPRMISRRGGRANLLDSFQAKYAAKTPEEFLESIVDLRGFLHHHSVANPKIWNPSLEYNYELGAILLQDLCFRVCSTRVESLICFRRSAA